MTGGIDMPAGGRLRSDCPAFPGGTGIAWSNGQDIAPHELYENSAAEAKPETR